MTGRALRRPARLHGLQSESACLPEAASGRDGGAISFGDRLGLCAGMSGQERVRILLNVLGAQREVQLSRDAVEPV
jgi:hypothetical protein